MQIDKNKVVSLDVVGSGKDPETFTNYNDDIIIT